MKKSKAKKTDPGPRIDAALLELANDFRGSILSEAAANKITKRTRRRFRTEDLTDEEIERIAQSRMDPRHATLNKR
jgi:hypothetical protein